MMPRRFYLLLLGLLLAALLAACGGQPEIAVSSDNLELGDVVNGEVITREERVSNTGQSDLIIEAVTTSCGCTRATVQPMTIRPGETGTLRIEFDSGAHGPDLTGQLIRQIFILSNDPQQPELVVELGANILAPGASQAN